jgi:choline dehydrogenase
MLSIFVRASSISDDKLEYIGQIPSKPIDVDGKPTSLNPQDLLPDFEFMPLAIGITDDFEEHKLRYSKIGVFTFLTTLLRPKSRGTVRLASTNAHDRPKVDLNFMSDPADWPMIRKAIRVSMKLGKTMQAQEFPLIRGVVFPESEGDEDIDKVILRRARSVYHWSSTCRMAPESDNVPGVVADDLRVHGVSNLRVCDASIFPQTICTHTQAPVVMVAEKCADMIKEANAKKASSDLPP